MGIFKLADHHSLWDDLLFLSFVDSSAGIKQVYLWSWHTCMVPNVRLNTVSSAWSFIQWFNKPVYS